MAAADTRDTAPNHGDDAPGGITESFNRMNVNEQGDMDGTPKTEEEYAQSSLTLRAIVSSKEAGVIIGKAGKNVADLRDETGVKAGVSKVVQGVHDRVLTVTGGLQGTAKAYSIVAKGLLDGAPQMGMGGIISNNGTHRKFTQFTINGSRQSADDVQRHKPIFQLLIMPLAIPPTDNRTNRITS